MKLDLHGIKHEFVDELVEDFVLKHESPLRIITGNSSTMKDKVIKILVKHDFKYMIMSHNIGEIIVL